MQQTKAGLIQQCDSLSKENSRVWEVMLAQIRDKGIDLVGRFTANGWHVTVSLVNATRAHGGIVLIYSKQDDKNDSTSVSWLDEEHAYMQRAYQNGEYGYKMRELIGKAMAMRNRALDSNQAA
jgi:hypothetical protein